MAENCTAVQIEKSYQTNLFNRTFFFSASDTVWFGRGKCVLKMECKQQYQVPNTRTHYSCYPTGPITLPQKQEVGAFYLVPWTKINLRKGRSGTLPLLCCAHWISIPTSYVHSKWVSQHGFREIWSKKEKKIQGTTGYTISSRCICRAYSDDGKPLLSSQAPVTATEPVSR